MPFLILHKVRGQSAFDIAEPVKIGSEDGWIIPTSGHRAYPYWWIALDYSILPLPDDLPDHYSCNNKPKPGNSNITLEDLGL